jgi:hypothetical protein
LRLDAFTLLADQLEDDEEQQARASDYAADPALWAREKLGEHLWSKQVEIAESVRDNRLTAVQSCHGTGKSFVSSRLTAWWLDIHPPGEARVVTTAPTGDQVKAILWSEINGAFSKATARGNPFIGRINETEWKLGKRLIAFGRKPSDYNPHAFQGIHAKYVLVLIDEACGVNKQFWTAAQAIATGEHCRILAVGNPDDPGSYFARACSNGRWNTIRISAFDRLAQLHRRAGPRRPQANACLARLRAGHADRVRRAVPHLHLQGPGPVPVRRRGRRRPTLRDPGLHHPAVHPAAAHGPGAGPPRCRPRRGRG